MTIHFSNGRMHSSGLSCRDNASVTPMYIREKKTRGLYIGSSRRPTCLTLALDDGVDEEALEDSREGEYIEIGIVGPPHGVKGEFKVQSLTDWP